MLESDENIWKCFFMREYMNIDQADRKSMNMHRNQKKYMICLQDL